MDYIFCSGKFCVWQTKMGINCDNIQETEVTEQDVLEKIDDEEIYIQFENVTKEV